MIDRRHCLELDAADPLARCRHRFDLPDDVVYLDGNSLGALPQAVAARVERTVQAEWGTDLIRSWDLHDWIRLPTVVGDRIARLVGASPGSIVACDSTSINLYKAVSAAVALGPTRRTVVTDRGNFPTDLYVLQAVCDAHRLELVMTEPERVEEALDEDTTALVLTEVDYRTGRRHDMAGLTAAAHAVGAATVWDLSHSAGAFPVDLAGCDVDFAVGCGYKYLNGGPGAPAYLYVAPPVQARFHNPITGWLGHARPFDFSLDFEPADGIGRGIVGTPHILSLAALDAALDVFDDVDPADLRVKSLALTDLFLVLVDERLSGFEVATPRDHARRGSQVSLRHPDGYRIVQALIERRVVGDFRAPDVLRFGVAPLYVRFVDVWDAVDAVASVVEDGTWRHFEPPASGTTVT